MQGNFWISLAFGRVNGQTDSSFGKTKGAWMCKVDRVLIIRFLSCVLLPRERPTRPAHAPLHSATSSPSASTFLIALNSSDSLTSFERQHVEDDRMLDPGPQTPALLLWGLRVNGVKPNLQALTSSSGGESKKFWALPGMPLRRVMIAAAFENRLLCLFLFFHRGRVFLACGCWSRRLRKFSSTTSASLLQTGDRLHSLVFLSFITAHLVL